MIVYDLSVRNSSRELQHFLGIKKKKNPSLLIDTVAFMSQDRETAATSSFTRRANQRLAKRRTRKKEEKKSLL